MRSRQKEEMAIDKRAVGPPREASWKDVGRIALKGAILKNLVRWSSDMA